MTSPETVVHALFSAIGQRSAAGVSVLAAVQSTMDFCEIVIEDTARSDAEIQQAITDLAAKWGITLS